jgi:formamidopyrimidine-DNA glycosylase
MPELPEVETVRALLDRLLVGKKLTEIETLPDSIVYESASHDEVRETILGKTPTSTGRKGKLFWMNFPDAPTLMMHLGMSGWVVDVNAEREKRLVSHGKAPLEDPEGRPRFLKLMWKTSDSAAAFTDGRRLARIWLGDPDTDKRVLGMGPDVYLQPPTQADLANRLNKRTAPIKALLLDQKLFCGIGNWVADEVLYASGIAPQRAAGSLSFEELKRLSEAIEFVVNLAVKQEADESRYPEDWLFHVRWGGGKGSELHLGEELRRDQVGGRTTAWVPARQK